MFSSSLGFVLLLLSSLCLLYSTNGFITTQQRSLQPLLPSTLKQLPPITTTTTTTFLLTTSSQQQNKLSTTTQLYESTPPPPSSSSSSSSSSNQKKSKSNIDEQTKSRLITESIAPWRTLRLFLYIALGSGAALGGFITATGLAAALSQNKPDLDVNTEYINLAIDFGAVIIFAILTKIDIDKGNELNQKVEEKIQRSKDNKVIRKGMKERELTLAKLGLEIRVSEDENVPLQKATVEAVQSGGKQHLILVIGNKKAIRDALLGANILKMEFAMRDVLIVPYELNKKKDEDKLKPDAQKGFGGNTSRPTWEVQPYVAQTSGEGWEEYVQAELNDAIQQNGEKVKDEGIAIVVANTGEIIRRGVGQVPWRNMVEELEKAVKDDDMLDLGFLSG